MPKPSRPFTIVLPPALEAKVRQKIDRGEYPNESALFEDCMQALFDRDEAIEQWLSERVVAAYDAWQRHPASVRSAAELRRRFRLSSSLGANMAYVEDRPSESIPDLVPEVAEQLAALWGYIVLAGAHAGAGRALARVLAACEELDPASQRFVNRGDLRPGLRLAYTGRGVLAYVAAPQRTVIVGAYYGSQRIEALLRQELGHAP